MINRQSAATCQPAIEDNSKVLCALDDLDGGQQPWDVVGVDMLQLQARVEPHDLGLGRVQPQSAGSHALVDVVDVDCEAANGYPCLAD